KNYNKPFFATYVKTCTLAVYFFGFFCSKRWRNECSLCFTRVRKRNVKNVNYSKLAQNDNDEEHDDSDNENANEPAISEPIWVPIKYNSSNDSDANESIDTSQETKCNSDSSSFKTVRFNHMTEVRQLSNKEATEALFARLSHNASIQFEFYALQAAKTLTISQTAKLALYFCFLWFCANFSYQMALLYSKATIVNLVLCTSSFFTLILSLCSTTNSSSEKCNLSKFIAVLVSIIGVSIIIGSETQMNSSNLPLACTWALFGAVFYAFYTFLIRSKVDDENCIDMPLFFGFVGLFNCTFLWPVLFMLHYSNIESFKWPNDEQWCLMLVNGLIGTVLSELLWLWGCFLTSSLLATLSISLTIPLTVLFDFFLKSIRYPVLLFLGTIPVLASFVFVSFLCHYESDTLLSWDPITNIIRKALFRSRFAVTNKNSENSSQTQLLINEEI
ncbi:solute carrier family 35 member F5-like protein, partial [Dinothrombium tinctorium]